MLLRPQWMHDIWFVIVCWYYYLCCLPWRLHYFLLCVYVFSLLVRFIHSYFRELFPYIIYDLIRRESALFKGPFVCARAYVKCLLKVILVSFLFFFSPKSKTKENFKFVSCVYTRFLVVPHRIPLVMLQLRAYNATPQTQCILFTKMFASMRIIENYMRYIASSFPFHAVWVAQVSSSSSLYTKRKRLSTTVTAAMRTIFALFLPHITMCVCHYLCLI